MLPLDAVLARLLVVTLDLALAAWPAGSSVPDLARAVNYPVSLLGGEILEGDFGSCLRVDHGLGQARRVSGQFLSQTMSTTSEWSM